MPGSIFSFGFSISIFSYFNFRCKQFPNVCLWSPEAFATTLSVKEFIEEVKTDIWKLFTVEIEIAEN